MRIGQYVHFGIGGADRAAENLIRGLKALGVEVMIFYNQFSIPRPTSIYDDPDTKVLSRLPNYHDLNPIEIKHVSELNSYGIDLLGTHRSGDDHWALPDFENTAFSFKIVETNFHGALGTKADYRIFPSHEMVKHNRITCPHSVIPNPIMPPATQGNLRSELGIGDKFVFGRIARPTVDIYCDVNLKAYKLVENDNTVMLYAAPCKKARQDAAALGIKNIIFVESTVDPVRVSLIFNTMDVFCHSNAIGETFGNTIAEAMIHGKPVISHVGFQPWPQAQSEVLGPLHRELYLDSPDHFAYAALMTRLKNDKEFYDSMKQQCREQAHARFLYTAVAQRYLQVYEGVV